MPHAHDLATPRRPVSLMLNADLVRRAEVPGGDPTARVERRLPDNVAAERGQRLDARFLALNDFDETYGSYTDADNDCA